MELDLFSYLREDKTYLLIGMLYERWQPATKECITPRGINDEPSDPRRMDKYV
jgi:hypothetical protein